MKIERKSMKDHIVWKSERHEEDLFNSMLVNETQSLAVKAYDEMPERFRDIVGESNPYLGLYLLIYDIKGGFKSQENNSPE